MPPHSDTTVGIFRTGRAKPTDVMSAARRSRGDYRFPLLFQNIYFSVNKSTYTVDVSRRSNHHDPNTTPSRPATLQRRRWPVAPDRPRPRFPDGIPEAFLWICRPRVRRDRAEGPERTAWRPVPRHLSRSLRQQAELALALEALCAGARHAGVLSRESTS